MTISSVPPVTAELAGSETGVTLVIHVGADSRGRHSTSKRIAQVGLDPQRAFGTGYQLLESGASAHEAMVAAIHVTEDTLRFNAGRGTALTNDGTAQMGAYLMTDDGEVGAVIGVSTVRNPIDAARATREQTKHALSADPADAEIADRDVVTESNEYFITEQCRQSLARAQSGGDEWERYGTIGAVVHDAEGNIAAGTSTGGIINQVHGRVGGSPLPGCDMFANQSAVAVSYTGIGEVFIKMVVTHQVPDRMCFSGENVEDTATATLDEVAAHHGDGGMIVLPAVGHGVVAYNSEIVNFGYRSAREGKVQG